MENIPDGIPTTAGSYLIVKLNRTDIYYIARVMQEKPLIAKISDYDNDFRSIMENHIEEVAGQYTYNFQQSRESAEVILRNMKTNGSSPISGLWSLGLHKMAKILSIDDIKYPVAAVKNT